MLFKFIFSLVIMLASIPFSLSGNDTIRVYYGTKNAAGSQGIYTGALNVVTGKLSPPVLAAEAENPGFLSISQSKKYLYAVASGKSGQRIVAYTINSNDGMLTKLNSQETGGQNPCHVSVGPNDKYVVYANYTGGSCGMMPIGKDGKLRPRSSFFQHSSGSGVNKRRQEGPHPHCARTHPNGKFVLVPDLGQDKVRIYRVDNDKRKMSANPKAYAVTPPGGGPRHVNFHPNGKWMYVNNEMLSSVTAFQFNTENGMTTSIQTISTLPKEFNGNNSTAEILVHPNGKFLYCSNRGHNSIAAFSIDQESGKLTPIGQTSTKGKTPRNFNLTPDGKYVVAANQNSNDVYAFKVNLASGQLSSTGSRIEVPHCICVKFLD